MKEIRDKYKLDEILEWLDKIKDLKMLALGETIIDMYQFGIALGKSSKAPIVAFQCTTSETYRGGIIAINEHLESFINDIDCWTPDVCVVKKRYIQNGQKLFEVYNNAENPYYYDDNESLDVKEYDIILIADFGHGMFNRKIRDEICEFSNFISLNCQMNAGNMGLNTINKYESADYICISEHELRLAFSEQYAELSDILLENIEDGITVAITQGKNGCTIYKDRNSYYTPAFEEHPVDSTGAGDAFLAITTPLVYVGAPLDIVGFIGSCAGSLACSWQGNKKSVIKKELIEYIRKIYER